MLRFLYNRDQVCFVLKSITCMSCQLTETEATFPYHSDQFHELKILSTTDIPILSTTISSQNNLLLLTKYKSPGSGRFYFCCWFQLKITQVLDEILFITTLAGPAHLLQFVISLAGEHRGTAHPTPAWWPGGCWLSPGCGKDHLGWVKEQWSCLARLSGENASKHSWGWVKSALSRGQRAVSCPFHAGRRLSESIALKLETNGERLKKESFFSWGSIYLQGHGQKQQLPHPAGESFARVLWKLCRHPAHTQ